MASSLITYPISAAYRMSDGVILEMPSRGTSAMLIRLPKAMAARMAILYAASSPSTSAHGSASA